jgi:hypothetical protein
VDCLTLAKEEVAAEFEDPRASCLVLEETLVAVGSTRLGSEARQEDQLAD